MPGRSSKRVDTALDDVPASRVGTKRSGVAVSPTVASHDAQSSPKKRTRILPDSGDGVAFSKAATPQSVQGRRLSFGSSNDPPVVEKPAKRVRKLTAKGAAYQAQVKTEPDATPNLLALLDSAFKDGSIATTPPNKGKPSTSVSTTHAPPSVADSSASALEATPTAAKAVSRIPVQTPTAAKAVSRIPIQTPTPSVAKPKSSAKKRVVIEISDESDSDAAIIPPSSDPPVEDEASDAETLSDESSLTDSDSGARSAAPAQHASECVQRSDHIKHSDGVENSDDDLSDYELEARIERLRALRRARKGKRVADARDTSLEPVVAPAPSSPMDGVHRPDTPLPEDSQSRSATPVSIRSNSSVEGSGANNGEELEPEPYCELKTLSGYEPETGRCFNLDRVTPFLAPNVLNSFLSAEHFEHYRPFANVGRCDPSLFKLSARNTLVWAKDEKPVVALMPGGLTSSNVVDSFTFPAREKEGTTVKRMVIAPTEEHRDALRVFLKRMFNRDSLKLPIESGFDFAFSTKKQGSYTAAAQSKNSKFYGSAPKTGGSSSGKRWFDTAFPPCLDFDATVPVYNASAEDGFLFDKAGFLSLPKMGPYKPGKRPKDLHPDSVVVVGYTMNLWGAGASGSNLSLNIQFVVLLGLMQS